MQEQLDVCNAEQWHFTDDEYAQLNKTSKNQLALMKNPPVTVIALTTVTNEDEDLFLLFADDATPSTNNNGAPQGCQSSLGSKHSKH